MKKGRILSVILLIILLGGCAQKEPMDQDQIMQIQQENVTFYQERETIASQEVQTELQSMRELVQTKNYSFEIGYTSAMEYTIEEITGLVVPPDLDEQIMKQNERAEKIQAESVALGTCSATASDFDWRRDNGTTAVRDQMACGSCWAFANCGAYEGNYRLINSKACDISEQHLLDCNPYGYSCSGGWWVFQFFVDNGVASEADYPYTGVKGSCNDAVAVPYKAVEWGYVGSSSGVPSTSLIKQALCEHGPLSVAVLVTPLFQAYTSGVLDEPANAWTPLTGHVVNDLVKPANGRFYVCVSSGITGVAQPSWPLNTGASVTDGSVTWRCLGIVNHGVTLIGWDDSKNAWLIKNSWNTGWGDVCGYGTERGYMWIAYDCDNIGFAAAWVQAVTYTGCTCP